MSASTDSLSAAVAAYKAEVTNAIAALAGLKASALTPQEHAAIDAATADITAATAQLQAALAPKP